MTATVELVPTGDVQFGYVLYAVPESHDGSPISRAVGRCASGSTVYVPEGSPVPVARLEALYSDGERFWAVTRF